MSKQTEDKLRAALKDLVDECNEYVRINNLYNKHSTPASTHAMRHAEAMLSETGQTRTR